MRTLFAIPVIVWLAAMTLAGPAVAQNQALSTPVSFSLGNVGPAKNADVGLQAKIIPNVTPIISSSNGVLNEDTQIKMKNGFGAQFCIVDSDEFFLNWLRTDVRNLVPVALTRRGVPLYIAVFVLEPGFQRGRRGARCDVTYDYEVLKPDGGCADAGRNYVAWAARPPPPHIVELALSNIPSVAEQNSERPTWPYPRLLFGVLDPPGEYIVNVMVHDNVKKVDIPLQRKLLLVE